MCDSVIVFITDILTYVVALWCVLILACIFQLYFIESSEVMFNIQDPFLKIDYSDLGMGK